MMKMRFLTMILLALCAGSLANAQTGRVPVPSQVEDIFSDTWVATDGVGRQMPTNKEVGNVKTDKQRVVGIFYITWHGDGSHDAKLPNGTYYYDVSKVLNESPAARHDINDKAWHGGGSYHWGEPECGYFLSNDAYVMRRDISMLADAGVDVLILDVTNAAMYWDAWDILFKTMHQMKAEGNKVPQFCFWSFNGPAISVVQELYEHYYKTNSYRDLWFYWDGKPLLLCNASPMVDANPGAKTHKNPNYDPKAATDVTNPHYGDPDYCNEYYTDYTKEVKDFFTLRNMWWGYYKWNGKRYVGTEDNWSFGYEMNDTAVANMDPDLLVSTHNGIKEEAAVTPAQHPISTTGKCWRRNTLEPALDNHDEPAEAYVPWLGKTVKNPVAYGIYFQDRWDEAIKSDPAFLYLNDWNEWTAGRYKSGKDPSGTVDGPTKFLGRPNPFYFVDQYNAEFNRSISPMKGGYTDNYYMQMAENIRRYKGARPIPQLSGVNDFAVDGNFTKWNDVKVTYYDTKGDVAHRDYAGYGGNYYKNNSGRNDISYGKVAVGEKNVNFYVETVNELSPCTDPNWMLLLIDADNNHNTGWCGYDYIVNKSVKSESETTVMKWTGKSWKKVTTIPYAKSKNQIELAIPRTLLGLTSGAFTFDFKWADNPAELKDAISLCVNGDTAPNRRFNYRCIWSK
jgi:hypothetical protein